MSSDTKPTVKLRLLGFYRDPKNLNTWLPSGDAGQLTDCDPSDVIVGNDKEECVQVLERRYPSSDARMSRVLLYNSRHQHDYHERPRNRHENFHESDKIRVSEADRQFYTGDDLETAKILAQKFGNIQISGGLITCNDIQVKILRELGFMVPPSRNWSGGWSSHLTGLRYNPKGIARASRAAKTREATRAVLAGDVGRCAWELYSWVRKHLPVSYESGGGPYSRYSVCCSVMHSIKWFNYCFGPNAHRRHPKFQALKAEWKKRAKASRKVFLSASPRWTVGTHDPELFCNLMADEITKRNARVFKGTWVPLKEVEDFGRYQKNEFAKQLSEIEAADKAKEACAPKKPVAKSVAKGKRNRAAKRKAPHGELP